jgi:DNA-binding transcriptional ArsR family regulator
MAKRQRQPLDATFLALGDATRRGILEQLSGGETSVSEFAAHFGVSLPTIHKHLNVLERAGFISHEKRGRVRHVRLAPSPARRCAGGRRVNFAPLGEVKDWLAHFEAHWDHHLQKLKALVESDL